MWWETESTKMLQRRHCQNWKWFLGQKKKTGNDYCLKGNNKANRKSWNSYMLSIPHSHLFQIQIKQSFYWQVRKLGHSWPFEKCKIYSCRAFHFVKKKITKNWDAQFTQPTRSNHHQFDYLLVAFLIPICAAKGPYWISIFTWPPPPGPFHFPLGFAMVVFLDCGVWC